MKICYDNIVLSLQRAGGISTYWLELISRSLRDQLNTTFIELTNDNIGRKSLEIPSQNLIHSSNSLLFIERFRSLKLKNFSSKFIFHSSYNRVTANRHALKVVTIHDFVHEKYYKGPRLYLHTYQKSKSINAADHIIVVSENTKKDLLTRFPHIDPEKVTVIYNGVSETFKPLKNVRCSDSRPFLLFIGSREHYKNFVFSVKVIKELKDFDLYVVGGPLQPDEETLLKSSIPGRYKVFTYVDNARLNELYNAAYALLYPSSYEGFGIPLLEAMRCGTPFVALKGSSIPEVAGNAGVLLESLDVGPFVEAILYIKENRQKIAENGFLQVQDFSWERCYKQTLQLYKNLFNS